MDWILLYVIAFVMFMVIDLIWLGFIARNLYQKEIGHLLRKDTNWYAAVIFYLLYIGGLVIFVLHPSIEQGLGYAALYGAMFGFITYATYDLTNLATLKDWSKKMTIIDLLWGTFLGFSVATLSHLIFSIF